MKLKISYLLLFVLMLLISSLTLTAQEDEIIKNSLPKMLGNSNMGKEYYFTIPPVFEDESGGSPNYIKIFVSSTVRTLVTVEVEGSGYYSARNTVPNDVIEFSITPVQGQPFTKMGRDPNVPERIFPGKGIHITADQPLLVYVVCRYRYTSDGFLAIPVNLLGKEYIVAGQEVDAMFRAVWSYKLPNMTGVTAAFNDTRIRFTLGGNTQTRTAGGMTPGQTKEWNMRAGDVVLISTDGDNADLSGSKITSDKPVSVVTGNMCANIPAGNQWCDYIVEMDMPTEIWGKAYLVPKIPNRKFASFIKVFAGLPGTIVYKDGIKLDSLPNAGGTEGKAYLSSRMVPMNQTPRPVIITGDKPINVMLYNTGVQEDGNPAPNSDPFQMAVLPLESFNNSLLFNTPGIMGGMSFPENYIALVYTADEDGNLPSDFEFATVKSGNFVWENLNDKFPGNEDAFAYKPNGQNYAQKIITLPGDGVYQIRSKDHPFGAYLFGYSSYDSYGYPAGFAALPTIIQDSMPPVPTYILNSDGSVKGGIVTDMPDNSNIRSNLAIILMDDLNSFNYNFSYIDFIPGETRTTTWELEVIDTYKSAKATIVFMDRSGNDTTIVIEYEYDDTVLTITPRIIDYGSIELPSNKIINHFKIVNYSTKKQFTISDISTGTTDFEIDLSAVQLPLTLNHMDSVSVPVICQPSDLGHLADTVTIKIVGEADEIVVLKADAVNQLYPSINVSDIDFGTVYDLTSYNKNIIINNSGTSLLTIYGLVGLNDEAFEADFPVIDPKTGTFPTPINILPGANQEYNLNFKPDKYKNYNDFILFKSNAAENDSICIITAKAIDPATDVEDLDNQLAEIYPIPVTNELNIRLAENLGEIKRVDIVNMAGEIVYASGQAGGREMTIDLLSIPSGNYFLRITLNSQKRIMKKFNKTR